MVREQLRATLFSFILLTVVTGIFYPLAVTGIANVFFKEQANGSLIHKNGTAIGSSLVGQQFDDPKYLWGRLSATSPAAYNAASSSGSNYGPMNDAFLQGVQARVKVIRDADPANTAPIPADLVTASGSGLDPHISPAGAYYQIPRIARIRGIPADVLKKIIARNTQDRFLGILGEPGVNVLKFNLDLDDFQSGRLREIDAPDPKEQSFFNWKKI